MILEEGYCSIDEVEQDETYGYVTHLVISDCQTGKRFTFVEGDNDCCGCKPNGIYVEELNGNEDRPE